MASVNYYLKGVLKDSDLFVLKQKEPELYKEIINRPQQIFLKVSFAGIRLQIYTKRRISLNDWNKEKQLATCRKSSIGCDALNEWLLEFKKRVIRECAEFENSGRRFDKDDLARILAEISIIKVKTSDIDGHIATFLQQYKTNTGYSLKPNTVKKYKSLQNHLTGYCDTNHVKFGLQILTRNFLEKFKSYLSVEREQSDNTVAKYVKALKTFIRYQIQKGQIKQFNLSDVKSIEREGEVYVLHLKQILYLQNLALKKPYLEHTRDVFCFMCWTGQRFSDIQKLNRSDIYVNEKGEKVWSVITTKTDERISVPISEYADDILSKYQDEPFPLPIISNQRLNDYLKELGDIAGFRAPTKVVRYYDGKIDEEYVPFYEILTTHVARKSYITNSLMLGIPERIVRQVSGHKDEKSFRRYVKLAESYKQEVIQQAYSKKNLERVLK